MYPDTVAGIDAVVFDMDGVLCRLDDAARISHLETVTGLGPDAIVQAVWSSGFEDDADEGLYSAVEYLDRFGELLGRSFSRQDWVAYRRSGMTPCDRTLAFAAALAERMPVGVLTNNGHLLVEEIGALFPELVAIFGDRIWSSASVQARKPACDAYRYVCRQLSSEPGRTLMVDDLEANVQGALDAGLQAVHYQGPDESLEPLARRLA